MQSHIALTINYVYHVSFDVSLVTITRKTIEKNFELFQGLVNQVSVPRDLYNLLHLTAQVISK